MFTVTTLVFLPATVIFTGTGVLLQVSIVSTFIHKQTYSDIEACQVVKDVNAAQDALINIFEGIKKLTQDEVQMATAQLLTLTHGVNNKVTRIDDGVKGVGGKVRDIDDKVRVVHKGMQYVMLPYSYSYSCLCKCLYGQTERSQVIVSKVVSS